MKKQILLSVMLLATICILAGQSIDKAGTITDSRDGHRYKWVKIGTQTWMAENLAYLPSVNPVKDESSDSGHYYISEYKGNDLIEAKSHPNYITYGALYNWEAAKQASPTGWHLPGEGEWTILEKYLGMGPEDEYGSLWRRTGLVGPKLKSESHWFPMGSGNNSSRFNALPGGGGWYGELFKNATFWTSTRKGSVLAFGRELYNSDDGVTRSTKYLKEAQSVRCLMNEKSPVAHINFSPTKGTTKTEFQLDASGSSDWQTKTDDLEVRWDTNGDGTWDTGFAKTKILTHQYKTPGTYQVLLEVKDSDGLVNKIAKTLKVIDARNEKIFADTRDGKVYKWVKIGTQTWMAENMAYLPSLNPSNGVGHYVYGYLGNSATEAGSDPKCLTYGVLYDWKEAQSACPSGWHLPSDTEWRLLVEFLGKDAAEKMKETETGLWIGSNNPGANSSGFSALPAGSVNGIIFSELGKEANIWSSSAPAKSDARIWRLYSENANLTEGKIGREQGVSVRCLRNTESPTAAFTIKPRIGTTGTSFLFDASESSDSASISKELEVRWDWNGDGIWDTGYSRTKSNTFQFSNTGTNKIIMEVKDNNGLTGTATRFVTVAEGKFTDSRDGHEYVYKTIGGQTWMAENLAWLPNIGRNLNGDRSKRSPEYSVFDFSGYEISKAKASSNYNTYGVLYNWEAAQNACPSGWHLPSEREWSALINSLGYPAAGKMEECGTEHWSGNNADATNSSGLTVLPGGAMWYSGRFNGLSDFASFWTSTVSDSVRAKSITLYHDQSYPRQYPDERINGFSVRCVRGETDNAGRLTVATTPISGISTIYALGGGKVTGDRGTTVYSCGVCWSRNPNPTIADFASDAGPGTGIFTLNLRPLTPNTVYYVRAYARTRDGIIYGESVRFKTDPY